MYIRYNWQDIEECAEEMNRIYQKMDSIHSQLENICSQLPANDLSSIANQLMIGVNSINETAEEIIVNSNNLREIAELYYSVDRIILENNDYLFNDQRSIAQSSSNYAYSNQLLGELIIEPWLKKKIQEDEND